MRLPSLAVVFIVFLLLSSAGHAQTYNVPTAAPVVSAADRDWFAERRPILFSGDLYYPAGARYHFDPNVMVQTGTYDGVPLYADTSAVPYDQIHVPIGGGLVQPYERRRAGALAGTTGSHAPEFPVEVVPWEGGRSAATAVELAQFRRQAPTDEPRRRDWSREDEEARLRLLQPPGRIQTVIAPDDNGGLWIQYEGSRWRIAGKAVPYDAAAHSKIGEYRGFPVFAARGTDQIFIPAAYGMLAVYGKDGTK